VSRNDASTSLWLLKFVLVLFRICYLGVIILVHIGAKCANIVSLSGQRISWVTELRYLGIFLTCSRIFTCSTDSVKRSFYRSANAIFGKVGRIASEETVLELIKTKCIPAC